MSSKGIYSAVSGAIAQNQKLDTIANNLANVNTPAFKRDNQVFQEYLTNYEKQQGVIEVPKVPASLESFYDLGGGDRSYVDNAGTYTDFSQGALSETNRDFDMAIEGNAFFEVLTPTGIRLTRNGSFLVNPQGQLVTKEGHFVLAQGDENIPIEERLITLDLGGRVQVSKDGQIFQGRELVTQLSLQTFQNPQALEKLGSSLFGLKPNMDAGLETASNFKIHQGYIEQSNVNIVREMTDMIATTRLFESTQKAIQAHDKMDEKLYNQVPRLG